MRAIDDMFPEIIVNNCFVISQYLFHIFPGCSKTAASGAAVCDVNWTTSFSMLTNKSNIQVNKEDFYCFFFSI